MTREKPKAAKRNEYIFRGRRFLISTEELITAVRQARRLHRKLIDDLMEESEKQSAFLITRLEGAGARNRNHNLRKSNRRRAVRRSAPETMATI